ncbi:MAG: hypothetical protein NTW29_02725 [Bacteroidetes bacterium]|nr:hypothetical protein [Bacteroidota bacterium]
MLKKTWLGGVLTTLLILAPALQIQAAPDKPDTVYTGIYITSIHDIDFKQKEFTITFWLWLKYKNKDFDFLNNLEVPSAKSVDKSFSTIDSSGDRIYMQMKMQCVMKDSWKIGNFPFDVQKLRLSIENSQYDSRSLVFMPDTVGENYDPRFTLRGWNIDSCIINTNIRKYETGFGDESLAKPQTAYSAFRVRLSITRDAGGLFWKMFLGMYVAFLISFLCFYIHADGMDSRFGLSVGSLFAVIGNKYIIDSSLPESSSFTLVDMLHGITLFYILLGVAENAYSLRLIKQNKIDLARRVDNRAAIFILISYVLLNVLFIWRAYHAG